MQRKKCPRRKELGLEPARGKPACWETRASHRRLRRVRGFGMGSGGRETFKCPRVL